MALWVSVRSFFFSLSLSLSLSSPPPHITKLLLHIQFNVHTSLQARWQSKGTQSISERHPTKNILTWMATENRIFQKSTNCNVIIDTIYKTYVWCIKSYVYILQAIEDRLLITFGDCHNQYTIIISL